MASIYSVESVSSNDEDSDCSDGEYYSDTAPSSRRLKKLEALRKSNLLFYQAKSAGGLIQQEPCVLHSLLPMVGCRDSSNVDWAAVRERIATHPDDVRRPYVHERVDGDHPLTRKLRPSSWVLHQLLLRGDQVPEDVLVAAIQAFPGALGLPMSGSGEQLDEYYLFFRKTEAKHRDIHGQPLENFPLAFACQKGKAYPARVVRLMARKTVMVSVSSKDYSFLELFGFVLHMGYDDEAVAAVVGASDAINDFLGQKLYVLTTIERPHGIIKCKAGEDKKSYYGPRSALNPHDDQKKRQVESYLEYFVWKMFLKGFRSPYLDFWDRGCDDNVDRRPCWKRAKILFAAQGPTAVHAIIAQMPRECRVQNTEAWGNLLQCAQTFSPELFQRTDESGDLPLHSFMKSKIWSGGLNKKRGRVLVHIITRAYPDVLRRHDCDGRLPLHLAVKNYNNYGAINELMAESRALSTPDLYEGIRPFEIAWAQYWCESMKRSSNNTRNKANDEELDDDDEKEGELEMFYLTTAYKLIRECPSSVCHTNSSRFVGKIVQLRNLHKHH